MLEFLQARFSAGLAHSTLKVYVVRYSSLPCPSWWPFSWKNPLVTCFLRCEAREAYAKRWIRMLSYNLESSDLPFGSQGSLNLGMAASKAFLVLQRCRVVYAPHIRQVLAKDLRATPGSSVLLPAVLFQTRQGFASLVAWISRSPSVLTQLEFPEGNVPGYICNHGSLRECCVAGQYFRHPY